MVKTFQNPFLADDYWHLIIGILTINIYQNMGISVDINSMIDTLWLVENWLGSYNVVGCSRPNLINHHQNTVPEMGCTDNPKCVCLGLPLHFCLCLHIDAAACLWICIESILYEHVWPRLSKLELGSAPQISL